MVLCNEELQCKSTLFPSRNCEILACNTSPGLVAVVVPANKWQDRGGGEGLPVGPLALSGTENTSPAPKP